MTALDVPGFGLFEGGRAASLRGRWSLVPGGTVETRPGRGPLAPALAPAPWRPRPVTMPLLSGALVVGAPAHLTVGEISVAVDKTRSARLTLAEVTALGNRRYAVEVIASALGPDAGPDETVRLEGTAGRVRDGGLRVVLAGPAPGALTPGSAGRGSLFSGPFSPRALLRGSPVRGSAGPAAPVPGGPASGALIVSPARGAGFRLKLIATFAR